MEVIETSQAPAAIGTYNQAIKTGNTVYISGQIPLDPNSMILVSSDFTKQAHQVFSNLSAVCEASGGGLVNLVKITVYLTDLSMFNNLNEVMKTWILPPYPARAVIEISALPKEAQIEIDGVLVLPE